MERSELHIGEVTLSVDEAEEVLSAIRHGLVDAVVVADGADEQVYTFRDPSHPYRVLIEAMSEGAALVTFDGLICYHNPHFAALVDESGSSLNGRTLSELVAPEQAGLIDETLRAARSAPARVEVFLLGASGRRVPLLLSFGPARLADIAVCCVVPTDLSEHNRQEEQYRAARLEVEARDRLVSVAAHELRGPINVLLLRTEVLNEKAKVGQVSDQETARAIEVIHRQSRELAEMVGKLLDLGSITRGQLKLDREQCRLDEIVRDVHAEISAPRGGIVELDLQPVAGSWDRVRPRQVVTNLLSNAIKYGRGTPIEITVSGHGRKARLVVQDRGPGVPVADRERMFKPFERMAAPESVEGLGLGLYIAGEIVRAHAGTIWVEGEPGAGARFVVELPVERDHPE